MNIDKFLVGVVIAITLMMVAVVSVSTPDHVWQKQAIGNGHAHYCSVTGNFKWNIRREK